MNRRAASSFYWDPVKAGSSAKHILAYVQFQQQYERQLVSCVWLFPTPWTAACQSSAISWSLLRFMSIELVMIFNHLILCGPLLFLPSIFPSIRVFSMSQFFPSGGQSMGASASVSVLPMNIQGWFPLGLAGLILLSMGLSRVFSIATIQKHQNISYSLFPFNKWEWRSHLSCWVTQLGSCSGRRKSLGT